MSAATQVETHIYCSGILHSIRMFRIRVQFGFPEFLFQHKKLDTSLSPSARILTSL